MLKISVECKADLGLANEFRKCVRVLSVLSIAHDIHCPDINATDQGGINLIQEARSDVYTWS